MFQLAPKVAESEAGRFRLDLYYRLSVIQIEIPALRDRGEDIITLAEHYVAHFNQRLRKRVRGFSPDVVGIFRAYSWPGNVRELRNVIERVMISAWPSPFHPHSNWNAESGSGSS